MTQEKLTMTIPPPNIQFLDLNGINDDDRQVIEDILYGSAHHNCVEFPWDVDYCWNTAAPSEVSIYDGSEEYLMPHHIVEAAGQGPYHGTALVAGQNPHGPAQNMCVYPSSVTSMATMPTGFTVSPIIPVAGSPTMQPGLLPADPKVFPMQHDVKSSVAYVTRTEDIDLKDAHDKGNRRNKKKRSPDYCDKRSPSEITDSVISIDEQHHVPAHLGPPVHLSSTVPQTMSQPPAVFHVPHGTAMTPAYSQLPPYFSGPIMYPGFIIQGSMYSPPFPPNYTTSPSGGMPPMVSSVQNVQGEQLVQGGNVQIHNLPPETSQPSVIAHITCPVAESKPVQSQVPPNMYSQDKMVASELTNLNDSNEVIYDNVELADNSPSQIMEPGFGNSCSFLGQGSDEMTEGLNQLSFNQNDEVQCSSSCTSEVTFTEVSNGNADVSSSVASDTTSSTSQPVSWASLFKEKSSIPDSRPAVEELREDFAAALPLLDKRHEDETKTPTLSNSKGEVPNELGELLSRLELDYRSVHLQPRGLYNRGNWCYINATLQALLACPPFLNLMKQLPVVAGLNRHCSSIPIISSLVEFVHEFSPLSQVQRQPKDNVNKSTKVKEDFNIGTSFEPTYVYEMLGQIKTNAFKGRQEDAEEFLSCILNGLHEEMLAIMPASSQKEEKLKNGDVTSNGDSINHSVDDSGVEESDDEEDWQVMGPRKKSCVTRAAFCAKSPILEIFGGQIRSVLHQAGATMSATVQPFFTLQLDIQAENVKSVKTALEGLVSKEALEGYTCAKTKQEVEASRKITLEELPCVLILHLKRFVYDKNGGCQKLTKKIDFAVDLELNKELLSPGLRLNHKQRTYKLFAVVYHDGKEAAKGHYITDIYHSGFGCWLRADDSLIKPIPDSHVLRHVAPRVPYLLYYQRGDTVM